MCALSALNALHCFFLCLHVSSVRRLFVCVFVCLLFFFHSLFSWMIVVRSFSLQLIGAYQIPSVASDNSSRVDAICAIARSVHIHKSRNSLNCNFENVSHGHNVILVVNWVELCRFGSEFTLESSRNLCEYIYWIRCTQKKKPHTMWIPYSIYKCVYTKKKS